MTRVVACIDGSAATRPVLVGAGAIAELLGAEVDAVHVHEHGDIAEGIDDMRMQAESCRVSFRELIDGDPAARLRHECDRTDVVAVAMGARGSSVGPRPAGHVALALASATNRPVLLVPPEATVAKHVRRVVIAMKGTRRNAVSLERAVTLTVGVDVDVVVVHVDDESTIPMFSDQVQHETAAYTDEFLARYAPGAPQARVALRVGAIAEQIIGVVNAEVPDILALGWPHSDAPGRGAVARDLVDRSHVPVLLVAVA
jgi:nucleotide-binding universal stress UspA family protein